MTGITKSYPVFDCDGHLTELSAIWDYLSSAEKEYTAPWYRVEGDDVIVNDWMVRRGAWATSQRAVSAIECLGPGVNKKIVRKLREMDLSDEQREHVNFKGAREPRARLIDMDLQGIDQVVVVPIMMLNVFPWIEDTRAAALMARAYNDWVYDWCSAAPDRLFPAAALPLQDAELSVAELHRLAARGFRVAMIRPVDIRGRYPNIPAFEPLWRSFEETGIVTGMHALTVKEVDLTEPLGSFSPGLMVERALSRGQGGHQGNRSATLGFMHESATWMLNMLLSGFLERYPHLAVAILESNASWLPMALAAADRSFHLYRNERQGGATRLPSEIFPERCFISFEADERPVFRQHSVFEEIGVWASDVYHHDGSDAWTAIRTMREEGVPGEVQAKLLGENARRMYGIEPKLFTTSEPESYDRPDWYPRVDDIERELADRLAAR